MTSRAGEICYWATDKEILHSQWRHKITSFYWPCSLSEFSLHKTGTPFIAKAQCQHNNRRYIFTFTFALDPMSYSHYDLNWLVYCVFWLEGSGFCHRLWMNHNLFYMKHCNTVRVWIVFWLITRNTSNNKMIFWHSFVSMWQRPPTRADHHIPTLWLMCLFQYWQVDSKISMNWCILSVWALPLLRDELTTMYTCHRIQRCHLANRSWRKIL